MMELFGNDHYYVLLHEDNIHGLVCSRIDGSFSATSKENASELPDLKRISTVHGLIGKYLGTHLVLIKHRNLVGTLFDPVLNSQHEVYVIKNVLVLPLLQSDFDQVKNQTDTSQFYITPSGSNINDHTDNLSSLPPNLTSSSSTSNQKISMPWNALRVASALRPKIPGLTSINPMANLNNLALSQFTSNQASSDELNKRLVEEMCKLFTDTNSFYYSYTIDLTNSFQRQYLLKKERYNNNVDSSSDSDTSKAKPEPTKFLWQDADDRFFWNKYMLKDLIDSAKDSKQDINHWILPILHGFIQLEKYNTSTLGMTDILDMGLNDNLSSEIRPNDDDAKSSNSGDKASSSFSEQSESGNEKPTEVRSNNSQYHISSPPAYYQLGLISRRSKYRAGTRYKRRGCDEDGNCANFVETEQIFQFGRHFVSFLIVRGSIPLFWSQPGFKYRPAPVLTRSQEENFEAFSKHFKELLYYYGPPHILVDCTEQSGREKIVNDAYRLSVEKFVEKHPNSLTYIPFDFHRHCRGKRLLQVEHHLRENGLSGNMIKNMRYFWFDSHGLVCEQRGIFRINCIDCLDRTNIVQRAIALQVLDIQLVRLGLLPPEVNPESNHCKKVMQLMWANNGDVISRQYAGSNALKGDFTRTGERRFSGYLKDTYSSASRYYISKFRDAYRQAAMDAMLGIEDILLDNEILMTTETEPGVNNPSVSSEEKFEEISDDERMTEMYEDCRKMIMTSQKLSVFQRNFKCPSDTSLKQLESAMNSTIDWPSSESVDNLTSSSKRQENQQGPTDCGPSIINYDRRHHESTSHPKVDHQDPYEEDDYIDHAMLSIDFAEIQRLKDMDIHFQPNHDYSLPPIEYYKVQPNPDHGPTTSESSNQTRAADEQEGNSSNLEMSHISPLATVKTNDDRIMETLIREQKVEKENEIK